MSAVEEPEWEQYYPSYSFDDRDIVLAEYEQAANALEAEERVFATSTNAVLLASTLLGSLAFGKLGDLYQATGKYLSVEALYLGMVGVAGLFTLLGLLYFADRQKAILFAKRKLVVLRRMLGLSYGSIQLVLPSWRVEGASQPFAIKMFPSWTSYVAYPFWLLSLFGAGSILFITAHFLATTYASHIFPLLTTESLASIPALLALAFFAAIYRSQLFDTHESWGLLVTRRLSAGLRIRLVKDTEYIIYRARLATVEANRLGTPLALCYSCLTFIEDRHFFKHRGVSLRSIARASWYRILGRKFSGASTITQQLSRTLFIHDLTKVYRRKLVELAMALWLDRTFDKQTQLDMYLCSVRFAPRIYGIVAATRHFFRKSPDTLTIAEAFVLIERIGNLRSRLLHARIDNLLRDAIASGTITAGDAHAVVGIYRDLCATGQLHCEDSAAFSRLASAYPNGA